METDYCRSMKYDAEDPRCARLTVSGRIHKIPSSETSSRKAAQAALFSRHPEMPSWEKAKGHNFDFWTLELDEIWLIDFFGGASIINLADWGAAWPPPQSLSSSL